MQVETLVTSPIQRHRDTVRQYHCFSHHRQTDHLGDAPPIRRHHPNLFQNDPRNDAPIFATPTAPPHLPPSPSPSPQTPPSSQTPPKRLVEEHHHVKPTRSKSHHPPLGVQNTPNHDINKGAIIPAEEPQTTRVVIPHSETPTPTPAANPPEPSSTSVAVPEGVHAIRQF